MVDEFDQYWFNDDHPLAATILDLAWQYSGVRRAQRASAPFARDLLYADVGASELIPASLQRDAPAQPDLVGPSLLMARRQYTSLGNLIAQLTSFEATAQEVWREWRTERLRDMVHQTLHLGEATSEARRTLRAVCDADQQGLHDDPATTPIVGAAWVRATYLVSIDAQRILALIDILKAAIATGGLINQFRSNAITLLHQINYKPDSEAREEWLIDALKAEADAAALWCPPYRTKDGTPFAFIGGMPRPADVGTAGDQIFAVQLKKVVQAVADQVSSMATDRSVNQWAQAHPAEADRHPLVTEIPATLLDAKKRQRRN